MKQALVAGGLGALGQGIVKHLLEQPEWSVVALSRRTPGAATSTRYISVDLLDRADCEEKLNDLAGITHIFYAAYQERPTFAEEVAPNLTMLKNVLEVLERIAPALEHVNLMQGTKAYGTHLGPYKTPARESEPRHMPPKFYYDQEGYLKARSRTKQWSWSALRPRTVYGYCRVKTNARLQDGARGACGLPTRSSGTRGPASGQRPHQRRTHAGGRRWPSVAARG